ncbi:hypothetical protein DYB32_002208 [Aphanomyces invadans]|uniref:Uncharacterized protein n=1 Tax=Aphanomyces invadans TaxID=157072 RepID=A0A418B5B7_9STRA|nr:hypothetical protein DYB32_002208 [Aphanomyces invadans]
MGEKKHREDLEERNMLALCSLGDKSYKRPEHSPGFFNLQLHPRHLNIGSNNDAMESSRRQATDMDNDDPGTPHVQTTYETKKKIQMLLEEKAGVTLLSTSKAGQLSWEDSAIHLLNRMTQVPVSQSIYEFTMGSGRGNPVVYLDIAIGNDPLRRLRFEVRLVRRCMFLTQVKLFYPQLPITVENFRQLCTGEGKDKARKKMLWYTPHMLAVKDEHIEGATLT